MKRRISGVLALFGAVTVFAQPGAVAESQEPAAEVHVEDIYWQDYYAPPPDWRPRQPIANYNRNTRVPDLIWINYEGAYAPGLRIRPIQAGKIEKQIEVKLIDPKRNKTALEYSLDAEKDARNRTVVVKALGEPAGDFVEFSFKMKSSVKNAGAHVRVNLSGVGKLDTTKDTDKETACKDGFTAYKVAVKPSGKAVLREISIEVDPITAANMDDAQQEFVIFDMMFRRAAPKPLVVDLPPRQWIVKDGDKPIDHIYDYVNSGKLDQGVEAIDMPLTGWQPKDKEKDNGYTVEKVKETVDGREVDALRWTLVKGRRAYLLAPFKVDTYTYTYNTITFLYKIEVPEGYYVQGEDEYPQWGWASNRFNAFCDNFGVSVFSRTHTYFDWNDLAVVRTHCNSQREQGLKAPAGWTIFAWDTQNDDQTGNKDFERRFTTDWVLYYDNKKIEDGDKVVITIVNPKAAKGIMHTGGDMEKYRDFLAHREEYLNLKRDFSDSRKYLRTMYPEGLLQEPLVFIKDGIVNGEIIIGNAGLKWPQARQTAVDELVSFVKQIYAPMTPVPVLKNPSKDDNVKIFVGRHRSAPKGTYDDAKELDGTPGCIIKTVGKSVYIYGGNFNYSGEGRGDLNGVYLFLENNSDMIFPADDPRKPIVYTPSTGDFSIVWGNYKHIPRGKFWMYQRSNLHISHLLGARGNWHTTDDMIHYGQFRTYANNHCMYYGVDRKKESELWGLGTNGKRMKPGCYTGHPCLINANDVAKEYYANYMLGPAQTSREYGMYAYEYDAIGGWAEDTWKVCVCDKCTAPIRLANGTLVTCGEKDFRSSQFHWHLSAMVNAANVYGNPDMLIDSIAYFWMTLIPRTPVSRQLKPRFCPYVRKTHKEPIFAPANDMFWREYTRWGQLNRHVAQYEYFLYINFRPWCDIMKLDYAAETDIGVHCFMWESQRGIRPAMEAWVGMRLAWDTDRNVDQLRKYYIRRTFREAAPFVEKFYFTLFDLYYANPIHIEFEDAETLQMGIDAIRTPGRRGQTLADHLTGCLEDAARAVKHPVAKLYVDDLRKSWDTYLAESRKLLSREVR